MTSDGKRVVDAAGLLDRIGVLEARIAEIESRFASARADLREDLLLAVIAAAVATVMKEPFEIRRIENASGQPLNFWTIEGRLRHFASRPKR